MLWKDRIKLRDFSLTRTHKTKKKVWTSNLSVCWTDTTGSWVGYTSVGWVSREGSPGEGTACVKALRTKLGVFANLKKKPVWPGQRERGGGWGWGERPGLEVRNLNFIWNVIFKKKKGYSSYSLEKRLEAERSRSRETSKESADGGLGQGGSGDGESGEILLLFWGSEDKRCWWQEGKRGRNQG